VIDLDAEAVTLINFFAVRPENQDELLDALHEATRRTLRHRPGFIGATIHRSLDGKRVMSYSQWRSQADVEALQKDPAYREQTAQAAGLAERFEPALYAVSAVHERWPHASLPYSPDIFVSL
jgi:heme-degrading monooxygenase HmoA